jgi:hypothetical protein
MQMKNVLSCLFLLLLEGSIVTASLSGEVKMEKVSYFNQPNCYKLSNGTVEVIVTTDIGPRIIRYGFVGEDNIFGEIPEMKVPTELGDWRPWGGHRLWTAPEAMPRSYSPDNTPIKFEIEGKDSIHLIQPVEPKTGIQKEIIVTLSATGTSVTVRHKLTNRNLWAVDVAPWALTIMHGGGTTILPQEPYRDHNDYLAPARPLVLWHYTNLGDSRWAIGPRLIRLKTDATQQEPQKIGIANKQGWSAYALQQTLFVKRFAYQDGANYPDYGSNNETYTAGSFMEIETLSPIRHLEPGQLAEHLERWFLFKNVNLGTNEAGVEAALGPLIGQTTQP